MRTDEIEEFINRIKNAIIKLQPTLPKQLQEAEIERIAELLNEFVTFILDRGSGMTCELNNLIALALFQARRDYVGNEAYGSDQINSYLRRSKEIVKNSKVLSNPEKERLSENIPYLELLISSRSCGIANHADQYLYSSSGEYPETKDYFVKSHAQVARDVNEGERKKEQSGHDEYNS